MNYIYKIFLHFLIVGIFFGVGRLSAQVTVPEWQSQYAIGKINYGLILMYGHTTKLQISVREIMKILAII